MRSIEDAGVGDCTGVCYCRNIQSANGKKISTGNMCDDLVPKGKWTACSMLEKLQNVRGLEMKRNQTCCVFGLYVNEIPLIAWDSDTHNPAMQNVVEIFLAIVAYYMSVQYPRSEELRTDKRDVLRRRYSGYIRFIKKHWKTEEPNWARDMLQKISLKEKTSESELEEWKRYLEQYLKNRGIPSNVTENELDFSFYDILFEEYFLTRQNLVNKWGRDDPTIYEPKLITVNTTPTENNYSTSCVGFVCFLRSKRKPQMQGIVSCPFYRAARASYAQHTLGPANTILAYLHTRITNDNQIEDKRLRVDPISQNVEWINRLSQIPFVVDPFDERIQAKELRPKKKKKLLSRSLNTESESSDDS